MASSNTLRARTSLAPAIHSFPAVKVQRWGRLAGVLLAAAVSAVVLAPVAPAQAAAQPSRYADQGKPKPANETASASVSRPEPSTAAASDPVTPTMTKLTGRIVDENGEPLVGATVLLKGTSTGTSTDAHGNYALDVPSGVQSSLIFGYGGYEDQEMSARGTQPLNVTLTPRAKSRRRR